MRRGGSVAGLVSLVMIFCAVCLCIFAVLTLSAADRERALSDQTAEQAAAYYAADRAATEHVAALSEAPEGETRTFSFPAGTDRTLEVLVRREGREWVILRWQTVFTGSWETDDTLELWGGF